MFTQTKITVYACTNHVKLLNKDCASVYREELSSVAA